VEVLRRSNNAFVIDVIGYPDKVKCKWFNKVEKF
jgi:hypothetical protein